MYLYGGYSGSERLADMHAYDFETNHWSVVESTTGDAPSGRSSLVAQVHENCLYVFGGYNGSTVLNDFYKFRLRPIGVPPPSLVNNFRSLINQPDMSDVKFLVEGQEVYAHRAILAVRSEYFRVLLFNGRMRESVRQASVAAGGGKDDGDGSIDGNAIEIGDVSLAVFLKVLEYLYTDMVCGISLEFGIHLLIASELFMLDRLKALCEDIIRRDIQVDNVIRILVASHRHNARGLKDIALEFILQNLSNRVIQVGLSV
jgi:leucine-zipper-like transcriptional regulator 1